MLYMPHAGFIVAGGSSIQIAAQWLKPVHPKGVANDCENILSLNKADR
jgi:hypothetical protein